MIKREHFIKELFEYTQIMPVCAILGPRQCGKTTLAREFSEIYKHPVHFFDLENPDHLNELAAPKLALEPLNGLIVIDEIQRRPELFPYIRYLSDYTDKKFLILGSASRDLIHQSSETLAGRIAYIELTPFNVSETQESYNLWLRGGFPRSYLSSTESQSQKWRKQYIFTFLERDLQMLGIQINPKLMRQFWMMIAHYHGNIANFTEIGRSLGISDMTARRYLEILNDTFMIRILRPWFVNISKRQVKSPKIYVRDSGLYHSLIGFTSENLIGHPNRGSSWEGFALEETIRHYSADAEDCYFWGTQAGAELDLLIVKEGQKRAFEFKYADTPKATKSMHSALETLGLQNLTVVVPGDVSYKLSEEIHVLGLDQYMKS